MKRYSVFVSCFLAAATGLVPPAFSSTPLTVNCASTLRGVTHCGSGSLYGITETKPADIGGLVAPLKPFVFTNPARAGSGYQQPFGAAITVAGRLKTAVPSARVMVRLADICPGWPYQWPGQTSWLNAVTSFINDKKASGNTNFYGYEIWNEPKGTWNTANGSFNTVLWKPTYDKIRQLDSGVPIVGPSYAVYNHDDWVAFLTFCKANNCLPDVACWHELSTGVGSVAGHIKDYRAIETSLGISARKIAINEYCDPTHAWEGQPGSTASFVAKFERYKVDSAGISWWFTGAPGRLGSLLATDTQKGAGWWLYQWYGEMTGNMVAVTPSNENSTTIDGFACVDSTARYVSAIMGGTNDGTVNVTFTNLPSFIGATATVRVQKVDWSSKDTVSQGSSTVLTQNFTVSGGQITVSVGGANGTSGYRVFVLPGISNTQVRYEAENAMVTEAKVVSNSNTSNGKFVGNIDYNNTTMPRYSYVDFLVNAPSTRTYTITIKYANGTGATSTQGLKYNNSAWATVTYPNTGGWFSSGNAGSTVTVSASLNAGMNIVRLAKGAVGYSGGTGYAELDYIEVR